MLSWTVQLTFMIAVALESPHDGVALCCFYIGVYI